MKSLDEVVVVCRVRRVELRRWVEQGWLLPVEVEGDWQFADIDIARASLIRDLRRDFGVNEAAVPLILDLIDQRQDLEAHLKGLLESVGQQPDELRHAVLERFLGARRG